MVVTPPPPLCGLSTKNIFTGFITSVKDLAVKENGLSNSVLKQIYTPAKLLFFSFFQKGNIFQSITFPIVSMVPYHNWEDAH